MSALQHDIPGATVLDLFAGSGALGLEALSRGADHATFVEIASAPIQALTANIERLRAGDAATVVRGDAVKYAASLAPFAFDLAFADPPYDSDAGRELVETFARTPFARLFCIEHRANAPLPELPDARSRRYGDTVLTFIPAPE